MKPPHFRIHVFRTRRLIHTPSLSWLQNLNFKFGALRRQKRRGLAFYTRTSCLRKHQNNVNGPEPEKKRKTVLKSMAFSMRLIVILYKSKNTFFPQFTKNLGQLIQHFDSVSLLILYIVNIPCCVLPSSRAPNVHNPPPPKTPKNDKIWLFGIPTNLRQSKTKTTGKNFICSFSPAKTLSPHIFDSTSDKLFPASISLRNAFFASQEEKKHLICIFKCIKLNSTGKLFQ